MTPWDKYFGTPEKAAKSMNTTDAEVACIIWQQTIPYERIKDKTFEQLALEWLQEECDD